MTINDGAEQVKIPEDQFPVITHVDDPSELIHHPKVDESISDEPQKEPDTGDVNGTRPDPSSNHPMLIIVMGVSGCGKSTLGEALGNSLGVPFVDADKLHPKANIDKMAAGEPLTDEDRKPWLELVRTTVEHMCVEQEADENFKGRRGVVVGCSSLKRSYRSILRGEDHEQIQSPSSAPAYLEPSNSFRLPTYFIYIKGERDSLMERMLNRRGHFMKASMLDSQLATLESPEGEEGVVVVDLEDDTPTQIRTSRAGLHALAGDL